MWALFTIMFYARIPPALVHLMHIQRLSSVVVVAQQQQEVKVVEGEPWAFVQKKKNNMIVVRSVRGFFCVSLFWKVSTTFKLLTNLHKYYLVFLTKIYDYD